MWYTALITRFLPLVLERVRTQGKGDVPIWFAPVSAVGGAYVRRRNCTLRYVPWRILTYRLLGEESRHRVAA